MKRQLGALHGALQSFGLVATALVLSVTPADAGRPLVRPYPAPVLDQPTWTYDIARGDHRFGRAMTAAGRDVLVGGSYDDGSGGRAIVFEARTGRVRLSLPPRDCCEEHGLFGLAVAASPQTLVVGSPYGEGIHLFDRRTGAWLRSVSGIGQGMLFGRALDWGAERLLVGAPWHEHVGAAFVIDARTGRTLRTFAPPAGAVNADTFGATVAVAGVRVAVGAPGAFGFDPGPGSVFVYDAGGRLEATLVSPSSRAGDLFGTALAGSAGRILAGTPRGGALQPHDQAADLFERRAGRWVHARRFQVSDTPDVPTFGTAVAMDDRQVAVGAPSVQAVYVFDLRSGALVTIVRALPPDDPYGFPAFSQFGESIALVDGMLIVGAPGDDEDVSGHVFGYRLRDP